MPSTPASRRPSCCRSSSRIWSAPAATCRSSSIRPRPDGPRCCAARARRRAPRRSSTTGRKGCGSSPATGCSQPSSPAPSTPGCCSCATTARCASRDVLEPAIHYAEHGHPLLPRAADTIAGLQRFLPGRMADIGRAVPAGRIGAGAAATVPQLPAGGDLAADPRARPRLQAATASGRSRRRATRSTAASSPRRSIASSARPR